jgi:hypothetical protein
VHKRSTLYIFSFSHTIREAIPSDWPGIQINHDGKCVTLFSTLTVIVCWGLQGPRWRIGGRGHPSWCCMVSFEGVLMGTPNRAGNQAHFPSVEDSIELLATRYDQSFAARIARADCKEREVAAPTGNNSIEMPNFDHITDPGTPSSNNLFSISRSFNILTFGKTQKTEIRSE